MHQTQTEWEDEMSRKILAFIRQELYQEFRYMKPALSALDYRRMDGLFTIANDGRFLYFSTEPALRIFQKNPGFLERSYLHTILHCLFRQLWLTGGRDRRIWNTACDIAVEYTIDSMDRGCTKRILSWLRKDTYAVLKEENRGISAAVIYRWLKQCSKEKFDALEREFYTDDHRFWPKEEEMQNPPVIQAKRNWDKTARQVRLEQIRRGNEREVGEEAFTAQIRAGESRRNYRDFLRKFAALIEEPHLDLEEFDLGYYSYGLTLYGNLPLIEPLESREVHKIREFILVIDTSYSTSGRLVEGFLRETFSILSQKNTFSERFRIRLLQCDEKVRKEELLCSMDDLERALVDFQIIGGGGTDFRPAFSYVEELILRGECRKPDGLLYFTDGRGIYPKKMPEYKTAFLFLEDFEELAAPPWAVRLRLDQEDLLHEY